MSKPIATALVSICNHAAFVKDALSSILAQSIPLQIVIADDASDDDSFQRVQARLANYQGKHQLQVMRNPQRLGVGGNANRLMSAAEHELMIGFQGDDIALPHKAEALVAAFEREGPELMFAFGAQQLLHDPTPAGLLRVPWAGTSLTLAGLTQLPPVMGAAMARRRELFTAFGPLRAEVRAVDWLLMLRGLLRGKIYALSDVLVLYRRHAGGVRSAVTATQPREFHRIHSLRLASLAEQIAADVATAIARGWQSASSAHLILQQAAQVDCIREFHQGLAHSLWRGLLPSARILAQAQLWQHLDQALRCRVRYWRGLYRGAK